MTSRPTQPLRVRATRRFGLAPGQIVGSYRILDELGGGGMGVVYLAEHSLLGRKAAVKVLRPEYSHLDEAVQRFFAEARATTVIRHPGIVEVYDFGYTEEGLAYLVMELLEGISLARRLEHEQRIPLPVALVLTRRIALALSAAHERGIIHRDVKPDNIFLVRDGDGGPVAQVKLLDFGIARLIEGSTQASHRTNTGVVMGTPVYMSPEQCRGVAQCDLRSDLYSLGCVMFEMLAGRPPFVADSGAEMLVAHLSMAPPDVRSFASDTPREVVAILERLLAKDPGQRFDHVRTLVAAIDAALGRPGIRRRSAAIATVAAPTCISQPWLAPVRARRWASLVAGALGLGLVVATGIALVARLAHVGPGGEARVGSPPGPIDAGVIATAPVSSTDAGVIATAPASSTDAGVIATAPASSTDASVIAPPIDALVEAAPRPPRPPQPLKLPRLPEVIDDLDRPAPFGVDTPVPD